MSDNWKLKGRYFESCSCDTAVCPCIFLQSPTEGYCKALIGWAIDEGHMDSTDLSGLNVGLYLNAPGDLTEGGWQVALYLDDRASEEQKAALKKIYHGEVGGHPAVIASLFGKVMGVHSAAVKIDYGDKEKSLVIEGIGEARVHAVEGAEGEDVTVHNPPLAVAPGHEIHMHKTDMMKYDHEEQHSHSGTTSLASAFTYQP